jgi:hypothetical protein
MKTEGKIRHKLKQIRYRILQREIRKALSRRPKNCCHAGVVRGHASEELFAVCLLGAENPREWEGLICDESVPNTCPFFVPSKTREQIEVEVDAILNSGNMGLIASHYPDVAALLWVLAGVDQDGEESEKPSPQTPPEEIIKDDQDEEPSDDF